MLIDSGGCFPGEIMLFKCIADLQEYWKQGRGVELNLAQALERCPPNMKGDVTLNCFKLAKPLGANPMELAAEAVGFLASHDDVLEVEAVKAFVNLTLGSGALFRDTVEDAEAMLDSVTVPEGESSHYLIEYSAPNTNKPMHLGHVRNNALGLALCGILQRVGHKVTSVNLVNDRGIHICRSMLAYQRFGDGCTPESTGIKGDHLVGDFYVKYAAELAGQIAELKARKPELGDKEEKDIFLETEIGRTAQEMLIAWENGNESVRALWERMNGWVLDGFNRTYERMGVHFDKVYYESGTYLLGRDIIERGLAKGVFYRRDDGAVEVDLKKHKLDKKVLLRSDGTSVYITQDIGTTLLKMDEYHPDSMIWVVGDEQIYHFKVLFAVMKELGYAWADSLYHLAYGMVNLPSGRMKSREGTVVDADNLFEDMRQLAREEIIKRAEGDLPGDIDSRSEIIGMGALKFMLLKVTPKTTILFDPEAAVKFEGDTGAYVQYSCTRISSIQKKAAGKISGGKVNWALLGHEKEKLLALACAEYGDVVKKAASDLDTSCLANYLLDISKAFNSFYHDCPVIKDDVDPDLRETRLELISRVKSILVDGLAIMTIQLPDAM